MRDAFLDPKVVRARKLLREEPRVGEEIIAANTVHPDECVRPTNAPDVAWLVVDGP